MSTPATDADHPRSTAPGSRRRLKITVVTPHFPIAGEPYRGHSAFQKLRLMKDDADIEVICPLAVYPRVKWLNPIGFRYRRTDLSYRPPDLDAVYFEYPVLPLVSRPFNGLTCARYLAPRLAASNPDVVLNYWVYPEGFAAASVAKKYGIPVVIGSIGSDLLRPGDPLSFRLIRKTLRAATAVVTASEHLRRHAIAMGVAPDRVSAVLNGCDFSLFNVKDRRDVRRRLGLPPDIELLLYVGWLSPTKGLVELVQSVAALAPAHPALRLAMIGEGAFQGDLERLAAGAGVSDRLLFLGPRPSAEVGEWMGACDVFCLPSHSEGCPNAVVEAIASGRPVVATNVGGIPELMSEECGFMVAPRDTPALTQAIDHALRTDWDHCGIASRFGRSWRQAADETLAICRRAAASRV